MPRCQYTTATQTAKDRKREPATPMPMTVEPSMFKEFKAGHDNTAVVASPKASKSSVPNRIHILGDDERSKFIAHALSGVYDSIELLAINKRSPGKVNPRIHHGASRRNGNKRIVIPEQPLVTPRLLEHEDDDSHIDQLVVSGRGFASLDSLRSLKHRLDDTTSICIMNDGLGVFESVQDRVFKYTDAKPNIILGHMTHRLKYDKSKNAIKELRSGELQMTSPYAQRVPQIESGTELIESMASASLLNAAYTPLDQWFRMKLPSVIFESVVEPLCVFLDVPYRALIEDLSAYRLMITLLDEVLAVVEAMPELEGSEIIRDFIRGPNPKRMLRHNIKAKGVDTPELAMKIARGKEIDTQFHNGYFVQRASRLDVPVPFNTAIHHMIRVKYAYSLMQRREDIPMETTGGHPGQPLIRDRRPEKVSWHRDFQPPSSS